MTDKAFTPRDTTLLIRDWCSIVRPSIRHVFHSLSLIEVPNTEFDPCIAPKHAKQAIIKSGDICLTIHSDKKSGILF